MNLNDATSQCKAMVRQNNGGSSIVVAEHEDVTESTRYSNTTRALCKLDVWSGPYGEQQIWAIFIADTNGASISAAIWGGGIFMTPTAKSDEIGIVFMDKSGNCRAMMATALDSSWKKVDSPDVFWTHSWAKALHDVSNGMPRTRPDLVHDKYGLMSSNDEVEITKSGPKFGTKGRIICFMSYKNGFGSYEEPIVLVGDLTHKGLTHEVAVNELVLSQTRTKAIDKKSQKEDTEFDMLMKFFSSSQHDPSNPWYKDPKDPN